jgi:hypothetical protein
LKKLIRAAALIAVFLSSAAYAAPPAKTASFSPNACAHIPRTLWPWNPTFIRDCYDDGYEDWRKF